MSESGTLATDSTNTVTGMNHSETPSKSLEKNPVGFGSNGTKSNLEKDSLSTNPSLHKEDKPDKHPESKDCDLDTKKDYKENKDYKEHKVHKDPIDKPVERKEDDDTKEKDKEKEKPPKSLKLNLIPPTQLQPPSISTPPEHLTGTKLDKSMLSNLNKSLKVKQKIISSKEPQPKSISEIINRSPQASSFPASISGNPSSTATPTLDMSESIPNLQPNDAATASSTNIASLNLKKTKKVPKQNRTDIFAAKLASAVDDVDSSDSDETFVYENNINEDFNNEEFNDLSHNGTQTVEDNESDNDNNDTIETIEKPADAEEPESKQDSGDEDKLASKSATLFSSKPMYQSTGNSSFASTNGLDTLVKNTRPATLSVQLAPTEEKRPSSPFNNSSCTSSSNPGVNTLQVKNNNLELDKIQSYGDVDEMYSDSAFESDTELKGRFKKFMRAEDLDDTNVETDEDEVDVDDVSSHDSYKSSKNLTSSPSAALRQKQSSKTESGRKGSVDPTSSITSKNTRKKSNTPSKLRSTTSKLFDKKGAQPRRYSIIPDDIDIEDFDDELIYYDNVRFPHNGLNTNNNSLNLNEQSPLIHGSHSKIPHYRSLNLNPLNLKRMNKSKRYLSTGQTAITPGSPSPNRNSGNNQNNSDIFPFPYPEQQNQGYYYGVDEYDEEAGSIIESQFDKPSRKPSGMFNHQLSNTNNHFILPRKNSFVHSNFSAIKRTIYTMVGIIFILTVGFLFGFFIASTKDLSNVAITDIQHAVVSQDELIFNMVVEAVNPGWFTIGVQDVELDIFARSGYLSPPEGELELENSVETILLGTIYKLESEMTFEGVTFHKELVEQIGEVKLVQPGKDLTDAATNDTSPDNSEKWAVVCKSPFDLIVKGLLKYKLPLSQGTKSVVVTKTSYIDPNTNE